jgi:hypothetical protein
LKDEIFRALPRKALVRKRLMRAIFKRETILKKCNKNKKKEGVEGGRGERKE